MENLSTDRHVSVLRDNEWVTRKRDQEKWLLSSFSPDSCYIWSCANKSWYWFTDCLAPLCDWSAHVCACARMRTCCVDIHVFLSLLSLMQCNNNHLLFIYPCSSLIISIRCEYILFDFVRYMFRLWQLIKYLKRIQKLTTARRKERWAGERERTQSNEFDVRKQYTLKDLTVKTWNSNNFVFFLFS